MRVEVERDVAPPYVFREIVWQPNMVLQATRQLEPPDQTRNAFSCRVVNAV